jgi:hypothetical protein
MKQLRSVCGMLFLTVVFDANACDSPDPGSVADRFKHAHTVAVVRVSRLSEATDEPAKVEGVAVVTEVLKGPPMKALAVHGYSPNVDCWTSIDVGREYLIFLPRQNNQSVWFSAGSEAIARSDVPESLLRTWRALSVEQCAQCRRPHQ